MAQVHAEEFVRLAQDLPDLGLQRGDVRLVCSIWFDPNTVFEVEFQPDVTGCRIRALLIPNQIHEAKTSTVTFV